MYLWVEKMKKILVIGCPGGGKSTFSRKLSKIKGIPLFYLDMIFHKPDKSICSEEEFDVKLNQLMENDEWILDGNYVRTLPLRLSKCDTVFWLDFSLDVCLAGISERRGKPREDMPWVETEPDEEFIEFVRNFHSNNNPIIRQLLAKTQGKEIHIFSSREMADDYLQKLEGILV